MKLSEITPLILTYNEEANLERALASLDWATQIFIVDSFSDDRTIAIANANPNVCVVQRTFDNHTNQWNFGLQKIDTEWTLAMDADYICTPQLQNELSTLAPNKNVYRIGFDFLIFGKRLRCSIYPPRASLFRTGQFEYKHDGHTQLLEIPESTLVGELEHRFAHDDRKSTKRWLRSQCNYADLELQKLFSTPVHQLGWKDKIRCWIIFAPVLTFVYCLIFKMLILDGKAGIYYTLQRTIAESILSLKLVDHKLRGNSIGKTEPLENEWTGEKVATTDSAEIQEETKV